MRALSGMKLVGGMITMSASAIWCGAAYMFPSVFRMFVGITLFD